MSTIGSKNICRMNEYNNAAFLKAHCSCLDDDHIHTLVVDYDDDLDIIDLIIYTKAFTPYKDNFHCKGFWQHLVYWYKDKCQRLSWIMDIVFKGYIQVETSFEFHGEEQIEDYLTTVANAKDRISYNVKMRTASQTNDVQDKESVVE